MRNVPYVRIALAITFLVALAATQGGYSIEEIHQLLPSLVGALGG